MKETRRDLYSGIFFTVLAVLGYFVIVPHSMKLKANAAIGPDFFPRFAFIIIGICGLVQVLRTLGELKKAGPVQAGEREALRFPYGKQVIFTVIAAAAILSMKQLGFCIAALVCLMFFYWFFGNRRLVRMIPAAVIYIALVYLVFSRVFRIHLPVGPFGF